MSPGSDGTSQYSRNRFQESIQLVLVVSSGVWLAVAEGMHHISVCCGHSLNLVTSVLWLLAALVLATLQHKLVWSAWMMTIFGVGVLSLLVAGNEARHGQYLLPIVASLIFIRLSLSNETIRAIPTAFLVSAFIGTVLLGLEVALDLSWVGRASAVVAPLFVICLLTFSQGLAPWIRVFAVLTACMVPVLTSIDTSRMATATSAAVLAVYFVLYTPAPIWRRVTIGFAVLLSIALTWSSRQGAMDRLVGRDASLGLGPFRINGEGRLQAANVASEGGLANQTITEWFGAGVGTAGQRLVDADNILDKPHNEWVRLWIDTGVVGIVIWVAVLGLLVYLTCVLFSTGLRDQALVAFAAFTALLGFSLSDNALSYTWLWMPSIVLVQWARLSGRSPKRVLARTV